MGEQEPSRWLDLDPERAGLPVRLDEPIGDSLMLRRVGVPREIGLLVDLEHLPSGQRVRLEVAPAERMPERLAVHGDLAVSSLDDIGHEVAEAIRAAVPSLLGGATRLHEPTRTERLKLSPPVVDWERELSQSPGSLKIADHCDEACAFCSSPRASFAEGGSMPAPELVRARLAEWAGLGIREVQFVDREPTLNPRLAEYVAFARDAGFGAIRVNTNGVALADGVRLAALVEAGLSELCVSLHAPGAELSDRITGRAGGFEAKLATIRCAMQHPIRVTINAVLTDENFRALPELARLVARELAGARPAAVADEARRLGRGDQPLPWLTVSFVGPVGDGAGRPDLLPRYRDAVPPLLEALDVGPHVVVHPGYALPPCCLPEPHRTRVFPAFGSRYDSPLAGRTWLPGCDACRLRPRCAGIWTAYLERFGDEEFVPPT